MALDQKPVKVAKPKSIKKPCKGKKPTALPPHAPAISLEELGWIRRPQLTALGKLGITRIGNASIISPM